MNDEAARLLAYPNPAGEQIDPRWSQRVQALVTSNPCLRSGSWLGELRSGRRLYLCRATRLIAQGSQPSAIRVAILIERPRTKETAVSCLSTDFHLTKRETEVVDLLAAGLTNKEIAGWLHLSANTVKTLLHTIMIKLQVSTRAGIVGALVPRTE